MCAYDGASAYSQAHLPLHYARIKVSTYAHIRSVDASMQERAHAASHAQSCTRACLETLPNTNECQRSQ
eukprot:6209195-Pleurochrysis_carterae.AAC.2